MAANERLEQLSLRDQVLTVLRKGLITGDLVPGELYSASAIASELGVSTSPVREAMLTLVNQGVMEAVRNRGFRVVPMGENDRHDVHELRMLIEIPSMKKLAGHPEVARRAAEFRTIAEENEDAAEMADLVGYLNSDRRFHLGLLDILGNDRLTALVDSLRDQTRQVRLKTLSHAGTLQQRTQEHLLILDALINGDGDEVERLMVNHLEYIRTDWGPADSAPSALHSA